MREILNMIICYFKGHDYTWHFSDGPNNTTWFNCMRCNKNEWREPKSIKVNASGLYGEIKVLTTQISDILNADDRFHYKGRGANLGVWLTTDNEEAPTELIRLHKNLASKGYGAFKITLFNENIQGLELKIEMFVPSFCEWETFFEGFIQTKEDFNRVLIMLGINK